MSDTKNITIQGYSVELTTNIDDDVTTQCFVEHNSYHASLALLEAEGVLCKGDVLLSVPCDIIFMIQKWAASNGY